MNHIASLRQRGISATLIGVYFLVYVFIGSHFGSADAQSYWSAPSYAANAELGACYDGIETYYEQVRDSYEAQLQSLLDATDTNEDAALLLIATGVAVGAYVGGPWTVAALIGGAVSALAVSQYFDGQRSTFRADHAAKVRDLNATADVAAGICENTHLNGGDPENDTDEPEMENSGNGVDVVGGSQTVGGNRGRVTATPVN